LAWIICTLISLPISFNFGSFAQCPIGTLFSLAMFCWLECKTVLPSGHTRGRLQTRCLSSIADANVQRSSACRILNWLDRLLESIPHTKAPGSCYHRHC